MMTGAARHQLAGTVGKALAVTCAFGIGDEGGDGGALTFLRGSERDHACGNLADLVADRLIMGVALDVQQPLGQRRALIADILDFTRKPFRRFRRGFGLDERKRGGAQRILAALVAAHALFQAGDFLGATLQQHFAIGIARHFLGKLIFKPRDLAAFAVHMLGCLARFGGSVFQLAGDVLTLLAPGTCLALALLHFQIAGRQRDLEIVQLAGNGADALGEIGDFLGAGNRRFFGVVELGREPGDGVLVTAGLGAQVARSSVICSSCSFSSRVSARSRPASPWAASFLNFSARAFSRSESSS